MEFVFISDTHGLHREVEKLYQFPDGDCIIHAGDVSNVGKPNELKDFVEWFSELPYKHKIFIAGNHDFGLEDQELTQELLKDKDITYLNDNGIELNGWKIWGTPWTPLFGNWAFMKPRGGIIGTKVNLIPEDTDILITHGPPFGRFDFTKYTHTSCGCEMIKQKVQTVKPMIHVFGHIHEDGGKIYDEAFSTRSINASLLDENYKIKNPIICWDSDTDTFYNTNPTL